VLFCYLYCVQPVSLRLSLTPSQRPDMYLTLWKVSSALSGPSGFFYTGERTRSLSPVPRPWPPLSLLQAHGDSKLNTETDKHKNNRRRRWEGATFRSRGPSDFTLTWQTVIGFLSGHTLFQVCCWTDDWHFTQTSTQTSPALHWTHTHTHTHNKYILLGSNILLKQSVLRVTSSYKLPA